MVAGDKPTITFADVAGVDEAKQELAEIVEFLKYPEKFVALGARIPKGVLLVGPPGTGKTLLSKAVAGEAGVPFFSISGSEFVEMFVGVGASRVRDLFDQAKKNSPCIVFVDELDEAIARGIAGPERKSRRISDKEKEVIAYHETGHALVMKALPHTDPVHKISIISRGMALGWTLSLPEEDKYLVSRDELMDQIAGIMGGRVAEEIVFGDITSGAENDIQKATQIARRMVTQWGMSDKLGNAQMGHREELVFLGRDLGEQRTYSEEVAAIIDEEIRSIVDHGYQTAKSVLTKSRSKMDAVVALEGNPRGSFHPLQSFPSPRGPEAFRRITIAVDATSPALRRQLSALARKLGARPRHVDDSRRVLYHAAAVYASNYVNVVIAEAVAMFGRIGWSEGEATRALMPLVEGAVENIRKRGPVQALTGPVRRGDAETVARHLEAVEDPNLYRMLGLVALEIAKKAGLDPAAAERTKRALTRDVAATRRRGRR